MDQITCKHCGLLVNSNVLFCTHCGKQLRGEVIDSADKNKKYFVNTIVLYFLLVLALCFQYIIALHKGGFYSETVTYIIFVIILIVFIVLEPKPFFDLLKPKFKLKPILLIIVVVILLCPFVGILSRFINHLFFNHNIRYLYDYADSSHPVLYAYIFVSLIPGIVEEFMFRGIMFNALLHLTRPKITILITAITFSFIHFSFVSLFWLIPFGLFLGYLRYRYRTLLYSIMCHMLYNALVISNELLF